MRRRAFIAGLGGAAILGRGGATAQQPANSLRTVGVLFGSADHADMRRLLDAFVQTLNDLGWVDGRNLHLDVRFSGGSAASNAAQAEELVRLRPDVLFAAPSNVVIALHRATKKIPIVFANVSDPIAQGVVDNLARPSGNVTGFGYLEQSLIGKWVQILREGAPGLKRVALMIGSVNASSPIWYRMFNEVTPALGIEAVSAPINKPGEIEDVIRSIAAIPQSALIVVGDTMTTDPAVRDNIVALTAAHRLPALYGELVFAERGGLFAYGLEKVEPYRRAATYVHRILKGESPSDLPVQQPNRFYFVINLKTANALGMDLPPGLVATADTIIE